MPVSKTDEFKVRESRLAAYAKALSHPARIAILTLLAKRKDCYCGDIVQELPLSQSTVSQHLKELKSAGLITGEIEGRNVCYCLNVPAWEQMKTDLSVFLNTDLSTIKCC